MRTQRGATHRPSDQRGFSLPELLVAVTLIGIVATLAAGSLRQFWFNQSLDATADAVVTQLRQEQEDAVSESAPLVFGARFSVGASSYTLFRYDPNWNGGVGKCDANPRVFDAGVFNAPVVVSAVDVANDTTAAEHVKCRTGVSDEIIFFYARGSSSGGTLTLHQPTIDRTTTISISALTGRITRS